MPKKDEEVREIVVELCYHNSDKCKKNDTKCEKAIKKIFRIFKKWRRK